MSDWMPLMINVQDKTVTCIGGGQVAARRIPLLIKGGAKITLISPILHEDLLKWVDSFQWEQQKLSQAKTFHSHILFIATDDPVLNDELLMKARDGQWVYAAHNAQKSDIHFPAVVSEPPVTFSISTGGAFPAYLPKLKQMIHQVFIDAHVADDLTFLEKIRKQVLASPFTADQKTRLLRSCAKDEFLRSPNRDQLLNQWIEELQKNDT
ncbi:precorrin-2 dehydrogenase/sirohydrochlorin ferrochelatase family protein [Alkalicoccobacillus murimartini]|uniref:precorrin-2 dehydrogenase n=1 Tax=Alkalicoccobacillus murimartini TaxID=171685 RepID=A0ABT9YDN5_9BACI|nr:bifunctional precorrin-2 dehydrogenase/sirohydrochlorin ferrochelatase [Alkalicoccobacillus murimartini]MDQ0205651.1 precorrin-2 dehydrogenase/sirohydrochlorin ferrochelatase [Alkalicoccobacillus murimartini]